MMSRHGVAPTKFVHLLIFCFFGVEYRGKKDDAVERLRPQILFSHTSCNYIVIESEGVGIINSVREYISSPDFFSSFGSQLSLNKSCKRSNAGCKYQALRIDLPAIIMPSSSFFPNKLRGSAHGASWLHPAEIFKPVTQEVAAFSQLLPLVWNSHCYYKRLLYKRSVCVTDTEPFTASSPNGRRKNNIYLRERGMTFCRFYVHILRYYWQFVSYRIDETLIWYYGLVLSETGRWNAKRFWPQEVLVIFGFLCLSITIISWAQYS